MPVFVVEVAGIEPATVTIFDRPETLNCPVYGASVCRAMRAGALECARCPPRGLAVETVGPIPYRPGHGNRT